jgi:hypothetical protein
MPTRARLIVYLVLLGLIDTIIPVPITALVLLLVVCQKPAWFRDMVNAVYQR